MNTASEHANVSTLHKLYDSGDFQNLDVYATEDMVLHRADREAPCVGLRSILDYEHSTGLNRTMDVEFVIANDYFGAVIGELRIHALPANFVMPFCGLWRFENGQIVEHWENAYDRSALTDLSSSRAGLGTHPIQNGSQ